MVALGIAMYDIVELANPSLTNGQLAAYATSDRFVHTFPDKKLLPAAQQDESRLLERAIYVESIRHAALQSLIFAGIVLAIDTVVFVLHWWIAGGFRSPLPLGEG